MTTNEPVEKNLKHKTDVMSWDDVSWENCDLNFRPPSLNGLTISTLEAYGQLLLASMLSIAGVIVVHRVVGPTMIADKTWFQAIVSATLVGLVVMTGRYRILPHAIGDREAGKTAGLVAIGCVMLFFAMIRLSDGMKVFDVGVYLLFEGARR